MDTNTSTVPHSLPPQQEQGRGLREHGADKFSPKDWRLGAPTSDTLTPGPFTPDAVGVRALIPRLVAPLLLLVLAALARAEWDAVELPRHVVLGRRDAQWSVAVTSQFLKDDFVRRESGLGFEVRGPDPFRQLDDIEPKLVGGWRLGINQFDFDYTDSRLRRTVSTEVVMLNLAVGYDYNLRRAPQTPFLGMYLHWFAPFRQDRLAGIRDRPEGGLDLSLGYRFGKGFLRLDQTLGLSRTSAQQAALGWSF